MTARRVGLVLIGLFVLVALIGPELAPYSAHAKSGLPFAGPSSRHWLGTDDGGVDMLSLLLTSTRVSVLVGFAAACVAVLIGGTVGIVSGYFGGTTDTVLMRITDYFLVIPDVPLMVTAAALFGRHVQNVIVIIGVIYWTATARLVRSQVKSVRERAYVKRARALGSGDLRILRTHVLPQIAPLLVANAVLMVSFAIFAETAISFLGLGDPSAISWGRLIQNAFTGSAILNDAWWAIVPPGLCCTVLVLACTMVGQSIEEDLNPRLRAGHLAVRRFRVRQLAREEAAA
jgi:peptide/nickel transport system permease protein